MTLRVLNELGAQDRRADPGRGAGRRGHRGRAGSAGGGLDRRRAVRRVGAPQLRVRELVPWVQMGGTGVDKVPHEMLRRPGRHLRTRARARCRSRSSCSARCSRSRSGSRTSGCTSRRSTGTSTSSVGSRGRTVGIVGLGGIGVAVAQRALAVRHACARVAPHGRAEPGRRRRAALVTRRPCSRRPTTSCSRCRSPRAREHLLDADVFGEA